MSDAFEVFVGLMKYSARRVPVSLRIHPSDVERFKSSIEEYKQLFANSNGFGFRLISKNDVIPGFVEVYDQHDKIMRKINLDPGK